VHDARERHEVQVRKKAGRPLDPIAKPVGELRMIGKEPSVEEIVRQAMDRQGMVGRPSTAIPFAGEMREILKTEPDLPAVARAPQGIHGRQEPVLPARLDGAAATGRSRGPHRGDSVRTPTARLRPRGGEIRGRPKGEDPLLRPASEGVAVIGGDDHPGRTTGGAEADPPGPLAVGGDRLPSDPERFGRALRHRPRAHPPSVRDEPGRAAHGGDPRPRAGARAGHLPARSLGSERQPATRPSAQARVPRHASRDSLRGPALERGGNRPFRTVQ